MKKAFAIMMVATVIGTAAFSQEGKKPGALSAGLVLLPNFGGATDSDLKTTYGGFGFAAYFDAKYAAVTLGFNFVTPSYDGNAASDSTNYFTFGLLGKYPFAIGERFTIAPALGFEYQLFTGSGDTTRADLKDKWGLDDSKIAEQRDNFVLKFGALADFTITGGFYARAGVLLDIGFAHKDREDSNFGVEIPIGVGYRF